MTSDVVSQDLYRTGVDFLLIRYFGLISERVVLNKGVKSPVYSRSYRDIEK